MKAIITVFLLGISITSFSQVNRYTKTSTATYEPMSYDELSVIASTLKNAYDSNQKYLYELKNWILEIKPQIQEEQFLKRLNVQYDNLSKIEDKDLARATKYLNQTENAVKEIISDYNIWVNNQSSNHEETNKNYAQLGLMDAQKQDFISAIRNFSKHLESDPNNTDVIFYRALSKSEIGDKYGAISDYEKIIELNSNYPLMYNKMATVYNNKAYCLVNLGRYEEALPFVEKALDLDQTEWFIWDTRGEINLELGNFDKSISDLTKALNIKKQANSFYLRGLAYIKSGDLNNGCQDLSKAGELGNDDAYEQISEYCNK